jgi:tetratricopeptide (TPR) repeat protein
METLNLSRHKPNEFEGKTLSLRGRNYRLGPIVRESDQGYSHILTNECSNLCLHIIQIRKEYCESPALAKSSSQLKEKMTANMRSKFQQEANPVEIPPITVIEANAGSFELHEISWGFFESPEKLTGIAELQKANELEKAKDYQAAIDILTKLLTQFPSHTVALCSLASIYSEMNDAMASMNLIDKVLTIEPNYAQYYGLQVGYTFDTPRRRQALEHFRQLKAKYPLYGDFDFYGIQACIYCGEAGEANSLLNNSSLPKSQLELLTPLVASAVQARNKFMEFAVKLNSGQAINTNILKNIEEIQTIFAYDPMVQANLAFAYYRVGQFKRASDLLMAAAGGIEDKWVMYCWANAAFSQIEQKEWTNALLLLHQVMLVLNFKRKVPKYDDAPGVVTFMSGEVAQESISPSAYDLVNKAIISCSDPTLITDEVKQLVLLYREAKEIYTNSAQSSSNKNAENSEHKSPKKLSWWQRITKH